MIGSTTPSFGGNRAPTVFERHPLRGSIVSRRACLALDSDGQNSNHRWEHVGRKRAAHHLDSQRQIFGHAARKALIFPKEDRADPEAYNRVLWQGLMGDQVYPEDSSLAEARKRHKQDALFCGWAQKPHRKGGTRERLGTDRLDCALSGDSKKGDA